MIIVVVVILAVVFLLISSKKLDVHRYEIDVDVIETPVKFAVLTDLHASSYGDNMSELITAVTDEQPDAVFFVGDIFDNHHENTNSWTLVQALVSQYPCYYVTGNHEMINPTLDEIVNQLTNLGVKVLRGTYDILTVSGINICIGGVDDQLSESYYSQVHTITNEITNADYYILLSHRPHDIDTYAQCGADLVISGHAHGGQWRIPLLIPNGLYAPNQGIFPKYTGGLYKFDNWQLLVSRGLDKQSVSYPRIFNQPEVLIVTIR